MVSAHEDCCNCALTGVSDGQASALGKDIVQRANRMRQPIPQDDYDYLYKVVLVVAQVGKHVLATGRLPSIPCASAV